MIKPRCNWTGHLKLSLVTIPVRVYPALNAAEKLAFHQLHKGCHQRLRQKLVCPVHGEVQREDVVKGYEFATDQFVVVEEADLEKVRLETTGTIDLVQFIHAAELDPIVLDTPYYVGPDGPVAQEGLAVIGEALRQTQRLGIGQVLLGGREKVVVLKPLPKGLLMFTVRYAAEVRPAAHYFADPAERPLADTEVALACKLIESKASPLNLAGFTDRYQTAMLDLIKSKLAGTAPVLAPPVQAGQVVNLMQALRLSVAQAKPRPQPAGRRNGQRKVPLAA